MKSVLRQRSYLILSVLTLALAVGANVVVFTVVNALWLKPRPVADPERVVVISRLAVATGARLDSISSRGFARVTEELGEVAIAGQVTAVGLMGDFRPRVALEAVDRPVELLGVTENYFDVLGVRVTGRDFEPQDMSPGTPPVAIISHRLWQEEFGGRQDIIGASLGTDYAPLTVIGVAAPVFRGARLGEQTDLWIPASHASQFTPLSAVEGFAVTLKPMLGLVRLPPDMAAGELEARLNGGRNDYVVLPLSSVYGAPGIATASRTEEGLLGVVALTAGVVLIAGCATLAALVLMHLERRRQELAIRLALGSNRVRLARRLLGELGAVAFLGFVGAMLIADLGLGAARSMSLPVGIQLGRFDLELDWRVFTSSLLVTAGAIVIAGLLPLIRFTRPSLVGTLTSSSTTPTASSLRLRRTLLAIHVAATVVVLVGAALFVRTVTYGFGTGAGFDVDRTVSITVQASMAQFPGAVAGVPDDVARRQAAFERLYSELQALPDVEATAIGSLPIRSDVEVAQPRTLTANGTERQVVVGQTFGSPGYMDVVGLTLLSGRAGAGRAAEPEVERDAVVTASLAEQLWPGRSPIGESLTLNRSRLRVAGVVGDFAQGTVRAPTRAGVIVTGSPRIDVGGVGVESYVARAQSDAAAAVPAITQLVNRIFPDAARADIATGRELLTRDIGRERLGATLFTGFGFVSFALGLAGVFGLVAYLAESRRREMGVRMALGATPRDVMRMAVGTGLLPVLLGTVAGLIAAAILARGIDAFLLGIGRLDAVSYAGAAGLMLAGATIAGVFAAWRIRQISPMEVMRE